MSAAKMVADSTQGDPPEMSSAKKRKKVVQKKKMKKKKESVKKVQRVLGVIFLEQLRISIIHPRV